MTRSSPPRAACVWICLLAAPAFAADWIAIKSPQELTALYSNKTFKGNGWTAHYRDDGRGVMILRSGKRIPRTWRVEGSQVCATVDGGTTSCFRFQRHLSDRSQIVITNVKDGMTFNATVEDGVPNF